MNKIDRLFSDTLESPAGKYSMKRITILVTFIFIILIGSFIVLSDKILSSAVNPYAIEVFRGLLIFESALLGIAEAGKKFENKVEQKDENNTEQITE